MSELKGVLLAIEHAEIRRDEMLKAAARVERSLVFARDQLGQLESYAGDTDRRWLASSARQLTSELVRHQYQFMDRLQNAITLQTDVIAKINGQLQQAKDHVMQAEVRLAGLKQILHNRQAALVQRQRRRDQRKTDEFAALLFARNRARPMSGERHDT